MRRRGFTLIEVLMSLAIFALAAVSLGAAYSNVLMSRLALKQDEQRLDDQARCRAAARRCSRPRASTTSRPAARSTCRVGAPRAGRARSKRPPSATSSPCS